MLSKANRELLSVLQLMQQLSLALHFLDLCYLEKKSTIFLCLHACLLIGDKHDQPPQEPLRGAGRSAAPTDAVILGVGPIGKYKPVPRKSATGKADFFLPGFLPATRHYRRTGLSIATIF